MMTSLVIQYLTYDMRDWEQFGVWMDGMFNHMIRNYEDTETITAQGAD